MTPLEDPIHKVDSQSSKEETKPINSNEYSDSVTPMQLRHPDTSYSPAGMLSFKVQSELHLRFLGIQGEGGQ